MRITLRLAMMMGMLAASSHNIAKTIRPLLAPNKPSVPQQHRNAVEPKHKRIEVVPIHTISDLRKLRRGQILASRSGVYYRVDRRWRVVATAYPMDNPKMNKTTYYNRLARGTAGLAADPRKVRRGEYVLAQVLGGMRVVPFDDRGPDITGDRIDFRLQNTKSAIAFGRQEMEVQVLSRVRPRFNTR